MKIHSKLAVALGPERKRWVRIVDAALVLSVGIGIGVVGLFAPVSIEPATLRFAYVGVGLSLPLIAWMLYRETTISRIERIAIMLLVAAAGFALLYVGMEQAANAS